MAHISEHIDADRDRDRWPDRILRERERERERERVGKRAKRTRSERVLVLWNETISDAESLP